MNIFCDGNRNMSCIFCDGDTEKKTDRTICVDCMKDEDKLFIFHILTNVEILKSELKNKDTSIKHIVEVYYELKRKKKDVKDIFKYL